MQRNPVIRWAGEPCSSTSCPGQKLQNAIGSGFSGDLGPDSSTSGRRQRDLLRRCHRVGRTESHLCGFPESDSPLAKLHSLDVVSIVCVFPFSSALQSPATRMPLFYVSHTAAAIDASEPDARWVRLVQADLKPMQSQFRSPRGGLSSAFTWDSPHAKRFRSGFMSYRVLFTRSNRRGLSITANTL
jgi:hypothetical protein